MPSGSAFPWTARTRAYRAPAGTFGALTLPSDATVHDSGVRDWSMRLEARYALGGPGSLFVRHEEYRSEDSGTLADGIVLEPTGDSIGQAVVYRNVNIDELRHRGVELSAGLDLGGGWSLDGDWTLLDVEDRRNPDRVLADSYPSKLRGGPRFDDGGGRVWGSYEVRRNGRREALEGTSPLGSEIPSFAVHHLRVGFRLLERHRLGVAIENLTDALYSEASTRASSARSRAGASQ